MNFKTTFGCIVLFFLMTCNFSCKKKKEISPKDVPLEWAEMTLYILKNTPGNSPTYASRSLGYIGLTMYESIVAGYPKYQSIAPALNQFGRMPQPQGDLPYEYVLSLNAGQAYILKNVYNQTSDINKIKIDSLEQEIYRYYSVRIKDKGIVARSVKHGKMIAERIFEWSKSDGGHKGYLKNFDKSLINPTQPGNWKPPLFGQSFSHYPLHPHWGKNRTFLPENEQIKSPDFISIKQKKDYFNQFEAVIDKNKTLTKSEKEAAVWWSDDPDETPTPPGHSYYLALLAVKESNANEIKAAETFAKVGMSLADAFRNCWKWKYQFFSERPNTFITENIDPNWESFWPDPPFPAFPSGHAFQAAAMATVLTDLYGDDFAFTDNLHTGRPNEKLHKTAFVPRSFKSFWDAANETANSRFYGGIHTPQDNQIGLEQGSIIGKNINQLAWKK